VADVAENLRAFLVADANTAAKVGTRIYQDSVPQAKSFPFIWFQRTGTDNLRCLGETTNTPFSHTFAVEVISDDIAQVNPLADLVRARLETAAAGSSSFGAGTVSNVFCEDQADDYLPRGADLNSGEHVAALQVEVYP